MAGWLKMPLGNIVLDRDPAPPLMERGTAALTFRPMSSVAKELPISAAAELLFVNGAVKSAIL